MKKATVQYFKSKINGGYGILFTLPNRSKIFVCLDAALNPNALYPSNIDVSELTKNYYKQIDDLPKSNTYPSSTKGRVEIRLMNDSHILNAIKKAKREGKTNEPWYLELAVEAGRRDLTVS